MAEGGSRRGDRSGVPPTVERPRRRRRVVKPAGWPRYMIAKRLKNGQGAYYWNARKSDIANGFSLHREALGIDYGAAIARADQLNAHLDAWRDGRKADRSPEAARRFGTVDWWLETYSRSPAFEKLKARTKPSYRYQLRLARRHPDQSRRSAWLTAGAIDHAGRRRQDLRGPPRRQGGHQAAPRQPLPSTLPRRHGRWCSAPIPISSCHRTRSSA